MKFIVLDRDGVINEDSGDFIKSTDEWEPITGSLGAIAKLTASGYRICIATNQSGLARGLFDESTLADIHQKLCAAVEDCGGLIEGIFFCPHGPDEACGCRKPRTGLLTQIERELSVSLEGQTFVGDSLTDLQAAQSFNMKAVLVRTGKGAETETQLHELSDRNVEVYDCLADFVSAETSFPHA